jgi:uncharacterized protein YggE
MNEPESNANKLNLKVDYRIITVALLLVIVLMLAIWKPWSPSPTAKDRTISVSGDATVKAAPDEFLFSPSYQFTNGDKDAALKAISAKSNEVVAGLKKLGVPESGIKNNADSWNYPTYLNSDKTDPTYNLNVTVTVDDVKLVQKVEDYLLTTGPTGSLTPQPTFSTAKQKELQSKARDSATKEARAKADQSAKNLGFKIGAVKSVDDGSGFGGVIRPMLAQGSSLDDKSESLTVQPGENELNYNVTVVYYIK